MRPVLILENQHTDQAGYLGTWLSWQGIQSRVINAAQESFPDTIEPYAALAVMGGGMSANDPLLSNRQAEILILQAFLRDTPVIGHCLGGQLMARALGARVTRAAQPEIGWQPIRWKSTATAAAWFGHEPTGHVIQWHYDTFELPRGAELVASSDACENQAFVWGRHLAMQFHIEIDRAKALAWTQDPDPEWAGARERHTTVQSGPEIQAGIDQYLWQHQRTAEAVYRQWLGGTEWAVVVNK